MMSHLEQESLPEVTPKEARQLRRRYLSKEIERSTLSVASKKFNRRRLAQWARKCPGYVPWCFRG
jgi:hypothetical protein